MSVNYAHNLIMFCLVATCIPTHAMDSASTTYDPQIAKVHELALKRGTSSTIRQLTQAIEYFQTTLDHPQRALLLKKCEVARTHFIPHIEREQIFTELLALEKTSPDAARWPKIRPLLEYIGAYLSVEPTLRDKLQDAICPTVDEDAGTLQEHDITYEQWRALVHPYALPEVTQPSSLPAEIPENAEDNLSDREQTSNHQDESTDATDTAQEASLLKEAQQASAVEKRTPAATKKKKKKKQAKKKAQEQDPNTCFGNAIKAKNFTEALALLKANKGNIKVNEGIGGIFPVQLAVVWNEAALLRELLAQGASALVLSAHKDPTTKGTILTTPLLPALVRGYVECAQLLLEAGANPNIVMVREDKQVPEHPLCLVAFADEEKYTQASRVHMLVALLKHGAKASCDKLKLLFRHPTYGWVVNLKDPRNVNLITDYMACTARVSFGGSILTLVANPQTLQYSPIQKSLKSLLGASINQRDFAQEFAYIVHQNSFEKAQQFLREHHQSFDVNAASVYYDDLPPLYFGVSLDSELLCTMLLEHHANPNQIVTLGIPGKESCLVTPLFCALTGGRRARLCQLLAHGADPNLPAVHSEPSITESPLDFVIAKKTSATFSEQAQSDLIRILLLKDATVCSKKVVILNETTQESCTINLKKQEDHERAKRIVLQDTDGTSILCKNNTLILIEK